MTTTYTVTITNNSGATQDYGLFIHPPNITQNGTPLPTPSVQTFIIAATPQVPATVPTSIKFPQTLLAICGTRLLTVGRTDDIRTFASNPITLSSNLNGPRVPGTLWGVNAEGSALVFDTNPGSDSAGSLVGSFGFQTRGDFTIQSAKECKHHLLTKTLYPY